MSSVLRLFGREMMLFSLIGGLLYSGIHARLVKPEGAMSLPEPDMGRVYAPNLMYREHKLYDHIFP